MRLKVLQAVVPGTAADLLPARYWQVLYDNFGGHLGDPRELDRFLQTYAAEVVKIQARKQGHTVTEQPLSDGSIKLTIQGSGGAA